MAYIGDKIHNFSEYDLKFLYYDKKLRYLNNQLVYLSDEVKKCCSTNTPTPTNTPTTLLPVPKVPVPKVPVPTPVVTTIPKLVQQVPVNNNNNSNNNASGTYYSDKFQYVLIKKDGRIEQPDLISTPKSLEEYLNPPIVYVNEYSNSDLIPTDRKLTDLEQRVIDNKWLRENNFEKYREKVNKILYS